MVKDRKNYKRFRCLPCVGLGVGEKDGPDGANDGKAVGSNVGNRIGNGGGPKTCASTSKNTLDMKTKRKIKTIIGLTISF